ncbi:unnamed protein product [Acanthoscelides obtectus]|uniref:Reverse transcriptase n=1 Tax=Acanthoscelides obtectus TaxID=200917 RepID=A0A9P0VTE8_ACAOB|nr:unnamed protein product [Acanthoscelides obtectus]CAK1685309.1 hypothetical protein AOBTE_LOCUS35323 [Acanthoscelides obtectus]
MQDLVRQWKAKPLHGRYRSRIEDNAIDTKASQGWLQSGNLFLETEGFIASIQDQVVPTKLYRKRIMHENVDDIRCRVCGEKDEHIDHIVAGCSPLAPKQYLERHNDVAKILYQALAKKHLGETGTQPYYKYTPPPVIETETSRLYWNRKIITDRPIPNNIPDIVLTLKEERTTFIIDIAVPLPTNIQTTHAEKINKYLPLSDEIKRMWEMGNVSIIPVIIGATGEIPRKLHKSLEKLQLHPKIYLQLQKAALLGTCRTVRRVLGDENRIR